MERKQINKIVIIGLSVLSAAGIGFYIYHRIKIKRLNQKVSTVDELLQKIEELDVPSGPIEPTPVDEQDLPNMEFDSAGKPVAPTSEASYGGYGSYN